MQLVLECRQHKPEPVSAPLNAFCKGIRPCAHPPSGTPATTCLKKSVSPETVGRAQDCFQPSGGRRTTEKGEKLLLKSKIRLRLKRNIEIRINRFMCRAAPTAKQSAARSRPVRRAEKTHHSRFVYSASAGSGSVRFLISVLGKHGRLFCQKMPEIVEIWHGFYRNILYRHRQGSRYGRAPLRRTIPPDTESHAGQNIHKKLAAEDETSAASAIILQANVLSSRRSGPNPKHPPSPVSPCSPCRSESVSRVRSPDSVGATV